MEVLASAPSDKQYIAYLDPFGNIALSITVITGILFFVMLFYYAVKMRTERIQAIALIIITLGVFSTTYFVGSTGDSLIAKHQQTIVE